MSRIFTVYDTNAWLPWGSFVLYSLCGFFHRASPFVEHFIILLGKIVWNQGVALKDQVILISIMWMFSNVFKKKLSAKISFNLFLIFSFRSAPQKELLYKRSRTVFEFSEPCFLILFFFHSLNMIRYTRTK